MKTMKLLIPLVALTASSFLGFGQTLSVEETSELIAGRHFRFVAKTAHTTLQDLNTVNLDTYYAAEFRGDSVVMSLPYLGQRYNGGKATTDSPLDFESVMSQISESGELSDKRGVTRSLELRNRDQAVTFKCVLRIFDNGRASLQVTAPSYTKIDFNGYIAPLETQTKKQQPKNSK